MIRFELERALLDGDLAAADLPGRGTSCISAISASRRRMIGPDVFRTAIPERLIGYFPTYTLGNVYAAQIFAAAERAIGPLDDALRSANLVNCAAGWQTTFIATECVTERTK